MKQEEMKEYEMLEMEYDAYLLIACRPLAALVKLHEWGVPKALAVLEVVRMRYPEYEAFLRGFIAEYGEMDPAVAKEHLFDRCGESDRNVEDFQLFLKELSHALSAAEH